MRKVALSNLDAFFAAVAEKETLYLPVDNAAGTAYEQWAPGKKWSSALNTVRSAKDFFFPQTENLMDFKVSGKTIEIVDTRREDEDFVVFGVRACDVRSMRVLDNVFLAPPVDTYYQNRRSHGVIVSVACSHPAASCFCGTFGIDASDPEGDVVCYRTEDALYLNSKTEKGEALLSRLEQVTEVCDDTAAQAEKKVIRERLSKLPLAEL